jgi:N6-L-threonylcarbamoyladenine synthase
LDAVAATRGPGLAGALVVGYSFGKALAWSLEKPFYGIDHMEGHLFAPRLAFAAFAPPAVALLASGGHSQIIHIERWGRYRMLGSTIDDAAGEAFDKLARYIGLGYPGGPAIDAESQGGDPEAIRFPRALPDRPFDLSFSGLKTSVVTRLNRAREEGALPSRKDVAASIQEAIVDVLVDKTMNAVEHTGVEAVAGGGGVLANRRLRLRLGDEAARRGLDLFIPEAALCTDNGAMVAAVAADRVEAGVAPTPWRTDVDPGMRLA